MKYEAAGFIRNNKTTIMIEKQRYEEVKRAQIACLFSVELEEKLALLLDNFAEFEFELLRLSENSLIWPNRNQMDAMQERLTLDRRIVNLLTSCRLYLDQTDRGISRLFGNPSKQLNAVKHFKSDLYDNHKGYRVMESLRNYVQHSSLPVNLITYNLSRNKGRVMDYIQFMVIPQLSCRNISKMAIFKKSVLKELIQQGEKVDLRGPAREYVECLVRLHSKLREVISNRVIDSRSTYQAAVKEYSCVDGENVELPRLLEFTDDGVQSDEINLVTHFFEYHSTLLSKNDVNRNLKRSFASNSDQETE
jgi:hypothetical protein